jgi:hypothetical protein
MNLLILIILILSILTLILSIIFATRKTENYSFWGDLGDFFEGAADATFNFIGHVSTLLETGDPRQFVNAFNDVKDLVNTSAKLAGSDNPQDQEYKAKLDSLIQEMQTKVDETNTNIARIYGFIQGLEMQYNPNRFPTVNNKILMELAISYYLNNPSVGRSFNYWFSILQNISQPLFKVNFDTVNLGDIIVMVSDFINPVNLQNIQNIFNQRWNAGKKTFADWENWYWGYVEEEATVSNYNKNDGTFTLTISNTAPIQGKINSDGSISIRTPAGMFNSPPIDDNNLYNFIGPSGINPTVFPKLS